VALALAFASALCLSPFGGSQFVLAASGPGTVIGWGADNMNQRGVPPYTPHVIAISAGANHSLALTSAGSVVAWGDDTFGETDVPLDLPGVIAISAGANHSLALKSDGTVVSWGSNIKAQTFIPAGLADVVAISAGWDFSLALGGVRMPSQAQPQGLFTRELQWVITGILGLIGLEVLVSYLWWHRKVVGTVPPRRQP